MVADRPSLHRRSSDPLQRREQIALSHLFRQLPRHIRGDPSNIDDQKMIGNSGLL